MIMKTKVLNKINSLIVLILGLLGFNSCDSPVAEYGTPHATFEATGTITDQENKPLKNIQVVVRQKAYGVGPANALLPEQYTDEEGMYRGSRNDAFPVDSVDIIVTDTAGVFESDSVRVKVDYDRSHVSQGDHWYAGGGYVQQDFQLKKK